VPDPLEPGIAALNSALPIVLLPVRLETRFLPVNAAPKTLWIRIYPDEVHADTHEPELTAEERAWAVEYWHTAWRAAGDAGRLRRAFQRLVDRYEAPRARYIAEALRPTNPDARPSEPLPEGAVLDPEPRFPDVAARDAAWTRAPRASGLPEQFVAVGYRGGKRVFMEWGAPLPERIVIGPTPDGDAEEPEVLLPPDDVQSNLDVDDDMRWMVDVEEAERMGLAIRVPVKAAFANGVDQLLVVGVRAAEGARGVETLTELLQAHRATGGLEVLPVGTPTNNTDERRAPRDPLAGSDPVASEPAPAPPEGSDLGRLASALGVDAVALGPLSHGDTAAPVDAMHAALWPSTLGYFVEQMLVPAVPESIVDELRQHFVAHVRGRGALPTLRIGDQPYGWLPVSAPGRRDPAASNLERRLHDLLGEVRRFWSDAAGRAARVGRTDDPARDLLEVLGTGATMRGLRVRQVWGRHFLENLWGHAGKPAPVTEQQFELQRLLGAALFAGLPGAATVGRLVEVANAPTTGELDVALVAEELSETEPLDDNYLTRTLLALLTAAPSQRLQSEITAGPVLALLVRHAARLVLGESVARIDKATLRLASRITMEPEFVDIERPGGTRTVTRAIAAPIREVSGDVAGDSFLVGLSNGLAGPPDGAPAGGEVFALPTPILDRHSGLRPHLGPLIAFRAALARLAPLPTAELDRLVRETLDTLSHRLDAWITSLADVRLRRLRGETPAGSGLGAWGYVENLAPRPRGQRVHEAESEPAVFEDPANAGYVHAPSLNHAATAAVLRSGFLAHGASNREPLALDLSAPRVRAAVALLNGVRAGQSLGAQLGMRFERRLKEKGLAQYLLDFRRLAPLDMEVTTAAAEPSAEEQAIAGRVADGEALVERLADVAAIASALQAADTRAGESIPGVERRRRAQTVHAILGELRDAIDGAGDLLLAEAVHQTVQGNAVRAAAARDALQRLGLPPEPDVARTHRTGVGVAHRVLVMLPGTVQPPIGWPAQSGCPRAVAEPRLDRWAARLLGDPASVPMLVRLLGDADDVALAEERVTVSDLGLCAIDVLEGLDRRGPEGLNEVEARAVAVAAARHPELVGVRPELDNAPVRAGETALADFLALAAALREVLDNSRPLEAADLSVPEVKVEAAIDVAELETRADAAEASLRVAAQDLEAELERAHSGTGSEAGLRRALDALARHGIAAAIRARPLDVGDAPAVASAAEAGHAVQRVLDELDGLEAVPPGADAETRRARAVNRLAAIFGESFRVLPRFRPAAPAELSSSFAASEALQNGDTLAASSWLAQMSLVRPALDRYSQALGIAETLGGDRPTHLTVGQLPHAEGDRWVALPFAEGRVPAGAVGLLAHMEESLSMEGSIAGLAIDAWDEVVPGETETSGVAFHFDQPSTSAPNMIVLGVHPGDSATWDVDTLLDTLRETIALARIRAVDPEVLRWVGRFLPAIYVADNRKGDTPAIDFRPLVGASFTRF
jgi:hypothetical protein